MGVVRPAPSAINFLYFPLLLLFVSLLTWMLPTDFMLLCSSLVGGAVGAYTLWDLAFRRAPLRVSTVLAMTLLLGYCLGALNSWLTVPRAGLTLAAFFFRDPAAVSRGMASVLLACGILYCLGELLESPLFGNEFRVPLDSRTYLFVYAGTLLMVLAYATGATGFMGAVIGVNHRVGVFSTFSTWFASPLFALTFCIFINTRKGAQRTITGVLFLIQLALLVPLGRRVLIYGVVLAIFSLRFGEHRFRFSIVRKAVFAALAVVVISVGSTAFYYLRIAGYGAPGVSFAQLVQRAIDLRETTTPEMINSLMEQNVEKRTFIIGYLSDLLNASEKSPPAMGQDLVGMIEYVIPSQFVEYKDRFFQEEALADQIWGFSYIDEANSVLTAGAVDFGLAGIVLYPLMIVILLRAFVEIAGMSLPPLASLFIALATIAWLLEPEVQLSQYFEAVRDGTLFGIAIAIYASLPRFQWRHAHEEGWR